MSLGPRRDQEGGEGNFKQKISRTLQLLACKPPPPLPSSKYTPPSLEFQDSTLGLKKRVVETSLIQFWESGTLAAWSYLTGDCCNLFSLSPRKIFNDLSGSESPTKVETISEDIQAQSDGTEGASPIAVITTSALNYQQAPQTVTIPGTIQIVTSGEALQTVPMAQNSSGAVVQYQQQQQV